MKRLLLTTLCIVYYHVHAQHYVLDSVTNEMGGLIDMQANSLKFADDSPNFRNFFDQLDSLYEGKKEKLHIFHIGGSHIQADIYSNKLRTYFQNMNGVSMSQRGFIFPYHLAHTNNPLNYRVEADKSKWKGYRCSVSYHDTDWGLSGVTASFNDVVDTIRIKSNYKNYTRQPYCFNKLRVFYNTWQDNYELIVSDSLVTVVSDTLNPDANYREFRLDQETEEIKLIVRRKASSPAVDFLLMGLELMNDEPGVEYTSIGANGAKFKSYERCNYFENQLKLYKPDMFIVSIGTNDAYTRNFEPQEFRDHYEKFIEMILRVNPKCAILLTVPNDSFFKKRYPNKNTAIQQEIIYELAQKYDMAVWDFYQIMGGIGASQQWYENGLMPNDRIHFTKLGYSIKADLLLKAMVEQWERFTARPENSLLTYFKSVGE
ncbi:GDSL-type esterase/lipase family protein [Robertkochia solimangrovi]|uniref:GDSL-type esterase/lipase family protein n=1 Tax=Robertkochia solimangrovi TaxID=2213046 RepID=UPI0011802D18|nr:GDSL-type esterase/lipase family protein [Robertkochia solimangrovi]TRZ43213.1 hypothetical protein DMZ48_11020 [Robertkochia solimangrovi]